MGTIWYVGAPLRAPPVTPKTNLSTPVPGSVKFPAILVRFNWLLCDHPSINHCVAVTWRIVISPVSSSPFCKPVVFGLSVILFVEVTAWYPARSLVTLYPVA